MSITHSESVYVALVIQRARHVGHIFISGLPGGKLFFVTIVVEETQQCFMPWHRQKFKATMRSFYIVVPHVAVKNNFMTNTSAATINRS